MKIFNLFVISAMLLLGGCSKKVDSTSPIVPKAGFIYNFDPSDPDSLTVRFIDTSINADKRIWYFGDGDTSISRNPTHIYKSVMPGTIGDINNVKLVITSVSGQKDSFILAKITVGRHTIPVIKGIRITQYLSHLERDNDFHDPGTDVTFEAEVDNALSYEWDFGHDEKATTTTPTCTHAYKRSSNDLTLIVTSKSGDKDTMSYHNDNINIFVYDGMVISEIKVRPNPANKTDAALLDITGYDTQSKPKQTRGGPDYWQFYPYVNLFDNVKYTIAVHKINNTDPANLLTAYDVTCSDIWNNRITASDRSSLLSHNYDVTFEVNNPGDLARSNFTFGLHEKR